MVSSKYTLIRMLVVLTKTT